MPEGPVWDATADEEYQPPSDPGRCPPGPSCLTSCWPGVGGRRLPPHQQQGQNTDRQPQCIPEWVAKAGYDLDQVGWYIEVQSGRTSDEVVKTRVVFKLDRIARQMRSGVQNQPKCPRLGGP